MTINSEKLEMNSHIIDASQSTHQCILTAFISILKKTRIYLTLNGQCFREPHCGSWPIYFVPCTDVSFILRFSWRFWQNLFVEMFAQNMHFGFNEKKNWSENRAGKEKPTASQTQPTNQLINRNGVLYHSDQTSERVRCNKNKTVERSKTVKCLLSSVQRNRKQF